MNSSYIIANKKAKLEGDVRAGTDEEENAMLMLDEAAGRTPAHVLLPTSSSSSSSSSGSLSSSAFLDAADPAGSPPLDDGSSFLLEEDDDSAEDEASREQQLQNLTPRTINYSNSRLQIVHAIYTGLQSPKPYKTRYVTRQISKMFQRRGYLWISGELNHHFGDPAPGEPKTLIITFRVGGKLVVKSWREGTRIFLSPQTYEQYYRPPNAATSSSSHPNSSSSSAPNNSATSPRHFHAMMKAAAAAMTTTTTTNGGGHSPRTGAELTARGISPRAAAALRDISTSSLLNAILSYLPIYPDRLAARLVCTAWNESIQEWGLTSSFTASNYLREPPSFLEMIVNKSRKSLISLNLAGYRKMTDESLGRVLWGPPALLPATPLKLHHLDLTDCRRLSSTALAQIGRSCRHLKSLTLKRIPGVSDAVVLSIARNNPGLTRVDLSECSRLTDACLEGVAHFLRRVNAFFLKDNHLVTDRGVGTLLASGLSLRDASFNGLPRVKDLGAARWSASASSTSTSLSASSSSSPPISPLGTFSTLKSLNLQSCVGVDDAALESLCGVATRLKSLNVRFCHRITNQGIHTVCTRLKRLQHLDLCYLISIDDAAAGDLAKHLGDLRSLDLSHCAKVTNWGISSLSSLTNLTELRLCNMPNLSFAAVETIAASSFALNGSLGLLDLRHCDFLTPELTQKALMMLRREVNAGFKEMVEEESRRSGEMIRESSSSGAFTEGRMELGVEDDDDDDDDDDDEDAGGARGCFYL